MINPLKKYSNGQLVIIGARGMLGTALMNEFHDLKPIGLDRDEIDITNFESTREQLTKLNPAIIINAAAFTAVDDCEKNADTCMRVNGEAVGNLAQIADDINALIIHISTDYVFDGEQKKGYTEDDQIHIKPLNMYGASKARGEMLLREQTDRYYLIRTSWLYGENGKNFVNTMLKLATERDTLSVVNDQHGRPTYTQDLTKQIKKILITQQPFGTYHITNSGACTWFEFAQEIFRQSGVLVNIKPCTTADFPRPAKRPAYSLLNNTKLPQLRPWKKALHAYLSAAQSPHHIIKD